MSTAKCTVNRRELTQALARVGKVAKAKSIKPVLQNAVFSMNGSLKIHGTDLETYHEETLPTESEGFGVACVQPDNLKKIISRTKGTDCAISIGEDKTVSVDGFTLPSTSMPEDMPAWPEITILCERQPAPSVLAELLSRTVFATDAESSRYALNGILIEMDKQQYEDSEPTYLRLVATDGCRLVTDYVGDHAGDLISAILPAKAAKEMLQALKGAESCSFALGKTADREVDEKTTEGKQYFILAVDNKHGGATKIVTRAIEGRFPKWRDVLPKGHVAVCDVDADALGNTCQQALAVSSEDNRGIDICAKDDLLTVSIVSTERGKYFGELPVVSAAGVGLNITLDVRFVLDFCKAYKGHVVTILASPDPIHRHQQPILFQAAGARADYLVMPMDKNKK